MKISQYKKQFNETFELVDGKIHDNHLPYTVNVLNTFTENHIAPPI